MGGQQSGGTGQAIPKPEFLQFLTEFKQAAMPRLLEAKKENIRERMGHYKRNLEEYKAAVMGFMPKQQQIMQETMMALLQPKNISIQDLNMSMQRYLSDPEVQPAIVGLQTLQGDFCEGQPVPSSLNRDKFLEMVRFQTEEMRKYPINNMMDSLLAQVASADEVNSRFSYDEVTMAAAAIQFENLEDPELSHAREEWNEASRQEELSRRPPPQAGAHRHADGSQCSHEH